MSRERPALKQTLRAQDKLKLKSDFDYVKANGRKYTTLYFIALIAEPPEDCTDLKCGVICSRKFDKRAVVRNRARRLIWEAFRLLKGNILPCRMILIPRKAICDVKMNAVMEQMEKVLMKSRRMAISPK